MNKKVWEKPELNELGVRDTKANGKSIMRCGCCHCSSSCRC